MRRLTAARPEELEAHESVVRDLATEMQKQHSNSTSSALLMLMLELEEHDLGFMFPYLCVSDISSLAACDDLVSSWQVYALPGLWFPVENRVALYRDPFDWIRM